MDHRAQNLKSQSQYFQGKIRWRRKMKILNYKSQLIASLKDYMNIRLNCMVSSPWVHRSVSYKYDKLTYLQSFGKKQSYSFTVILCFLFSLCFCLPCLRNISNKRIFLCYRKERPVDCSSFWTITVVLYCTIFCGHVL